MQHTLTLLVCMGAYAAAQLLIFVIGRGLQLQHDAAHPASALQLGLNVMHTLITNIRAGLRPLCVPADSVQLFTSAPVRRTISRTEAPEGPAPKENKCV